MKRKKGKAIVVWGEKPFTKTPGIGLVRNNRFDIYPINHEGGTFSEGTRGEETKY